MIIFKTFAKSVLIYCFNLHFLDGYKANHFFMFASFALLWNASLQGTSA